MEREDRSGKRTFSWRGQSIRQEINEELPGWHADPLFGRLDYTTSTKAAEEQLQLVAHLRDKQPDIRVLNGRDAEIILPSGDDDRSHVESARSMPWFTLNERLSHIHDTTETWRFVGCELCFVQTGRREPDHGLHQCDLWPASRPAQRILQWLEKLEIPRFFGRRGNCSICGHG